MNKTTLLIFCLSLNYVFSQSDTLLKISDNWIEHLIQSGEIYTIENEAKAKEDYNNGKANYPVCLPSYLDATFDDINFDGKKDALFHFSPLDVMHGTGFIDQSDFGLLVVSSQINFDNVTDLTELIKSKLLFYYSDYQGYSTTIHYEGLRDGLIVGNFSTWVNEDAHCCPSFKGAFEYDYFRKSIKIVQE